MKNWNRIGISLTILACFFASAAAEENNNWPRKIEKEGTTVIIYQPQVESLSANNMESRAAVSVTTKEQSTPVFGAMWFDCQISTDRDDRTVSLLNMEVTAAKFPDVDADKIQKQLLPGPLPLYRCKVDY